LRLKEGSTVSGKDEKMKRELATNNDFISNPTWEDIYNVIESLDGKRLDNMSLEIVGVGVMLCGGGDQTTAGQRYIINFKSENGELHQLIDPLYIACNEGFFLTIGNHTEEYSAYWCVSKEVAIKAFKHFFDTGQMDARLNWEKIS
jgi:hypothetical protein